MIPVEKDDRIVVLVQKPRAAPGVNLMAQKIRIWLMRVETRFIIEIIVQIRLASVIVRGDFGIINIRQTAAAQRKNIVLALSTKTRDLAPIGIWTIRRKRRDEMIDVLDISYALVQS